MGTRRGGSNMYPQSRVFHPKFFQDLEVKFSIYLNRRVFVMWILSVVSNDSVSGQQRP